MKIKEDTKDVKYCCKADFIVIHKPHFYMSHKINRHSFKEICKKIILVVAMAQTQFRQMTWYFFLKKKKKKKHDEIPLKLSKQ